MRAVIDAGNAPAIGNDASGGGRKHAAGLSSCIDAESHASAGTHRLTYALPSDLYKPELTWGQYFVFGTVFSHFIAKMVKQYTAVIAICNSLISTRITASSLPNTASANFLTNSVLPTPVGPRNMNEPMGRLGSFSPTELRLIALTTFSTLYYSTLKIM